MISLAITSYNRSNLVIESFINILNDDRIDDIVIIDDCSDINIYGELEKLIEGLNNNKIRLFRNLKNLGPLLNKYEVVKKCKDDWLILLDSDNIINVDYIDVVDNIDKEDNVLYSPGKLMKINGGIGWNFEKFNNLVINKNNAKHYIDNVNFQTFLNTSNYYLNKNYYLKTIETNQIDDNLSINEGIYFSYLWLLSGNRMKAVKDLKYIHRVHDGSWYITNMTRCAESNTIIVEKIRQF